jgi:hypothetical protein
MITEARTAPPEDLISAESLDRCRPLTPEEIAEADAWLDQLERDDAVAITPATDTAERAVTSEVEQKRRRRVS